MTLTHDGIEQLRDDLKRKYEPWMSSAWAIDMVEKLDALCDMANAYLDATEARKG